MRDHWFYLHRSQIAKDQGAYFGSSSGEYLGHGHLQGEVGGEGRGDREEEIGKRR